MHVPDAPPPEGESSLPAETAPVLRPAPAVLLIEDDRDVADALCDLLVEDGYDVSLACDGQQALERLANGPLPQVILLDLMMPRMNGYEFRARQQQDPRLAGIPTVALTAGGIDRVGDLALRGWVRKPIPVPSLLALLGRLCRPGVQPHDHLVHFYEHDGALADPVADFLAAGLERGETAVAVATPAHAELIREALQRRYLDAAALERAGRLLFPDARATLDQLLARGQIRPARFDEVIGGLLDRLAATVPSRRIRAYGEMVDLLWQAGDVVGALELESCWNALAARRDLSLLCGYYCPAGLDSGPLPAGGPLAAAEAVRPADPRGHVDLLGQHSAVV